MSAYTDFVKANYAKVKHLPPKQRFVELGKMWRSHSGGKAPTKRAKGGVMSGAGMDAHGGGILSSALDAFGLGLPAKKRGRKARGGVMSGAGLDDAKGAGFLSGALGALGLGLDQKKLH